MGELTPSCPPRPAHNPAHWRPTLRSTSKHPLFSERSAARVTATHQSESRQLGSDVARQPISDMHPRDSRRERASRKTNKKASRNEESTRARFGVDLKAQPRWRSAVFLDSELDGNVSSAAASFHGSSSTALNNCRLCHKLVHNTYAL